MTWKSRSLGPVTAPARWQLLSRVLAGPSHCRVPRAAAEEATVPEDQRTRLRLGERGQKTAPGRGPWGAVSETHMGPSGRGGHSDSTHWPPVLSEWAGVRGRGGGRMAGRGAHLHDTQLPRGRHDDPDGPGAGGRGWEGKGRRRQTPRQAGPGRRRRRRTPSSPGLWERDFSPTL